VLELGLGPSATVVTSGAVNPALVAPAVAGQVPELLNPGYRTLLPVSPRGS
jgi:hypothetical protein